MSPILEITVGRKKLRLPDVDHRILRYYTAIAPAILPHLKNRMLTMALPAARPSWIRTCEGQPIVQDLGSLLWLVNAAKGELRTSAARCDDAHRPDYLEFDADRSGALRLRDLLGGLGMAAYAKTAEGGRIHVCAPIRRGPSHAQAGTFAVELARRRPVRLPDLARGAPGARAARSLAAVYSVDASGGVSAPVSWEEVERGVLHGTVRIDNISGRLDSVGDLWKPLTLARGRASIDRMIRGAAA